MPYNLFKEELVNLFSRSCNKHISFVLRVQQHHTFEEALAQAKLIEEAKIQDGEIKLIKLQSNQVSHEVPSTPLVVQLATP